MVKKNYVLLEIKTKFACYKISELEDVYFGRPLVKLIY